MTKATMAIVALLAMLAPTISVVAQDAPTPEIRTILVPGTETIIETGMLDGRAFARVSRDGGATYQALATPQYTLNLHYAVHDPVAGQPEIPGMLRSGSANRLFVVQFFTQPLAEYRAGLEKLGAEIHHYLANQSYLVRMNPARLAETRALPYVRHVGRFEPAYKLEPFLVNAILRGEDLGQRRYHVMPINTDRDETTLADVIRGVGGIVERAAAGGAYLEATLDLGQLLQIAAENTVLWIDRWSAPEEDMDNARIQGGANYIEPLSTLKYTGKGVRGMIYEGVYAAHTEFKATSYRALPIVLGNSSGATHGTATFGVVFARGASAKARGLCPDGQGIYCNYSRLPSTTSRWQIVQAMVDPNQKYKGMFQTASWGNSRTTLYTSVSADMDKIIFDHDVPLTQSQSNAGATSEPRASRPQAWAKNVISVGGTYHYDNSNPADDKWNRSGSIGPAQDGRVKPDLCAYYDAIYTTYSSTGYGTFGGTSGATPIVAGHLGLSLELYTDGLFGHPMVAGGWQSRFLNRPHFTTSKALLINTAAPYTIATTIHTRFTQGWGFPDLRTMYDYKDKTLVIDELDVLANKQSTSYLVFADGLTPEFRVTMTYADPPLAPTTAYPHRINDLSLLVKGPEGIFNGNIGLKTDNVSNTGRSPDTLNTVENVWLGKVKPGIYEVVVTAAEVNQDSHVETKAVDADFALIVRGIASNRDKSGLELALASSATGDFRVSLTKLPSGWKSGRVAYSADTLRPVGMGRLFGLEADLLTAITANLPYAVGTPYGFTYTTAKVFPNVEYKFATNVAMALKGVTLDAVAYVADGTGTILDFSNAARVTVK